MNIEAGETVALLGPNGAGKTTLVSALAGLVAIDAGEIRLNDRVLNSDETHVPPEARGIGVVPQDYVLFPHMTVVDNVAFGLRSRGRKRSDARRHARALLVDYGLAELGDSFPRDLSGGQAQRVALARALAIEPDLLLLDEPLAALDVQTRATLRRGLADRLERFEGPRLLITHDPTEAFLLADTVYVMEGGRVTQSGAPDEIRLNPRTEYAADLAGVNLVLGEATEGIVTVDGHPLSVADRSLVGPVLATIHPRAIALHVSRPEGSPRNAWQTVVTHVESLGDRARVQVGEPLSLTAEVTPGSVTALGLGAEAPVWVSIKATEITVSAR